MEENNKNKRKSIAEWIAVFLCIAAAPVPCITLMSATKVLSERWECIALWPALLCLVNVVQLFPRYYSADFCHIPPSRFLRTSVAEYRHEVCAFSLTKKY